MKIFVTLSIVLVATSFCAVARADKYSDIRDLLRSSHPAPFRVLGIATLDYTLSDLLGNDVALHDFAVKMNATLVSIDNAGETQIPAADKVKLFPAGTGALQALAQAVISEPKSKEVTWREITRGSFQHRPEYANLIKVLEALDTACTMPFTHLHSVYGNSTRDSEYFMVRWFLDMSDFLAEVGTFRYYDLVIGEACTKPAGGGDCEPGSISPDVMVQVEVIQAALQLGILREPRPPRLGPDCCAMPSRVCVTTPALGCATGGTGHCTFGSYYCP